MCERVKYRLNGGGCVKGLSTDLTGGGCLKGLSTDLVGEGV